MNDISKFLMDYGGPMLFAIVFVEQAGLPLPSAPWLLAAGALSANGKLNPALAIGATALAAVMADSIWFYVGRRGGDRVLHLFCRLSLSRNSCVECTKGLFTRHGLRALVAAKFLPGLGAVMPPLAGALGIKVAKFLLFDIVGSLFYGAFYIGAGFIFRNELTQAMALLSRVGLSAIMSVFIVVTGYIAFKYARRRELIGAGIRQDKANQTTIAAAERSAITGAPDVTSSVAELQSITLALTSTEPQTVAVNAPAPLVAHPL